MLPSGLRLTGMQKAALIARLGTRSHIEAADKLHLSYDAFDRRFSRAIAKLPWRVRNAYRSKLPRRLPKARLVRAVSLSDAINV